MISANKLYKQSGSTLPFSNWLEREKAKGKFIPHKEAMEEFYNADGSEQIPEEGEPQEIKKESVDKKQMNERLIRTAFILFLGYFVYKSIKK